MNLHQVVASAIGAVNPLVPLSIRVSTGYTTDENFVRVPAYAPAQVVPGQVQALTFRDIQQIDSLNLQGTRRSIYVNGHVNGLVRVENKGGDLITVPEAFFTGSITGTTLTVDKMISGRLTIGDVVMGSGVIDGSKIASLGTGSGGVGTYELDVSQDISQTDLKSVAVYLVAVVLEQWPDWVKVACTLQDGS